LINLVVQYKLMASKETLILDDKQITQKINRIAYQIYEGNPAEKNIIIAGIMPNGFALAKRVAKALETISPIKTQLLELNIDKDNPYKQKTEVDFKGIDLKNSVVVLVDDVLNSGKTLIYGAKCFLTEPIKVLRTAVLVDRNHSRYPIKADFVGLSLSTTLQEHVSVEIGNKGKEAVYLL
jgi:pyrimidine operon attenuation protein/uracil phosphoribosyltransferase